MFNADAREPAWGAGQIVARVAALVMLLLAMLGVIWMIPLRTEIPWGCDDFGYMRQAELFRDKGLDGFDTRLQTPAERALVEVMRASGSETESWYQAVAPHCHHYRESTDRVILQYPPGTGWLMSVFPQDEQQRLHRIVGIVAIGAVFAFLVGIAPTPIAAAFALAAGALAMWAVSYGSDSVAPATALAALCGVLALPALERRNLLALAALGLLCGLAGSVRIPNLIIPLTVGLILFVALVAQFNWRSFGALLVFGTAVLAGLAPLVWANFVNTGSFFATTYSSIDASAPRFGLEEILQGLQFYFRLNAEGFPLIAACAMALLIFIERPRSLVAATTLLAMLLSVVYFVPKQVLIGYYMTPISVFVLAVAAGLAALGAHRPVARSATGAILAAAVIGLGTAFCLLRPFPATPVPEMGADVLAALTPDTVVWADISGGRFVLDHGVYSAKAGFTSIENQTRMFDGLTAAGTRQIFVLEQSNGMKGMFDRLQASRQMTLLGDAYGSPVYEIGPALPTAQP